ncbi:MAG: gamma-butyrobetaine hydroxylase-like domain-containing protein [Methyloligellaceae bacterium]
MVPTEIHLAKDKKSLLVNWSDRTTDFFSAELLRTGSQSAVSKRHKIDGLEAEVSEDLTILEILPIGSYAINIVFSDGYDRGIFPWKFLRTLNERASAADEHSLMDEQHTQEQTMEV